MSLLQQNLPSFLLTFGIAPGCTPTAEVDGDIYTQAVVKDFRHALKCAVVTSSGRMDEERGR